MDLVIRPGYGRGGSCKQDGKYGSYRREGTFNNYGSQGASRIHRESAANGDSADIGDYEGHRASIGSGRRGKEGNGNDGISGTNEESKALELNGQENSSETDDPVLERPASQEFEHQPEVMYHLKRRMNFSPCECVSLFDVVFPAIPNVF